MAGLEYSTMARERSQRIRESMQEIFRRYNSLRLKKPGRSETITEVTDVDKPPFWDVVVLTTFDAAQQQSFQRQIDYKKQHGQLPKVPIYVVADPPDQKLGVGGSTLHVLSELHKELGNALYQKKLLVIHSGGSSQRLPSYSVLGKIFAPVPVKDLKAFNSADVVALGHPSSIHTGKGHGVYVLGNDSPQSLKCADSLQECMEVLQKPTEDIMRARGAVFLKREGDTSRELVWSDSVFWLSQQVCQCLLQWYKENAPLSSELDAYAHFLPCLGKRMVDAKPSDFQDFRSEMLPILQDFNLKVLLLNESEFYHMGTMEEYLKHFNIMATFCEELDVMKNTSNLHSPYILKSEEHLPSSSFDGGMIIDTYFSEPSTKITILEDSTQFVIENCYIDISFKVCGNLIMSNCVVQECHSISLLSKKLSLFGNLLYHTVPIIFQGKSLYVTVAFDLNANMKSVANDLSDIYNFGCNLYDVSHILGYKMTEVIPNPSNNVSLWTARIFMGGPTAAESFWLTHHAINRIKHEHDGEPLQTNIDGCKSSQLFSMSDVVKLKDLEMLLKDREHLSSCLNRIS
ncbi:fucose-1-phosphate guanylyltransferase-like isoform X3 [Panulirus ornatus]|uniref:fucose-1-phosphate guanylyltransferase-like isoform X3 n=1 Tax=Panulirus ornatus TaxID=150431 RepID=UPI003A8A15E1